MKKREMHITFHNPNTKEESNKIAEHIILQAGVQHIERLVKNNALKTEVKSDEMHSS